MSRFFSKNYSSLVPYVPGEQPKDLSSFVKLNTNESPFPPSDKALAYASENTRPFNLYSDPECVELRKVLAERLELEPDMLLMTNGSDEILNFAFMAFCDQAALDGDPPAAGFFDPHRGLFPGTRYDLHRQSQCADRGGAEPG